MAGAEERPGRGAGVGSLTCGLQGRVWATRRHPEASARAVSGNYPNCGGCSIKAGGCLLTVGSGGSWKICFIFFVGTNWELAIRSSKVSGKFISRTSASHAVKITRYPPGTRHRCPVAVQRKLSSAFERTATSTHPRPDTKRPIRESADVPAPLGTLESAGAACGSP